MALWHKKQRLNRLDLALLLMSGAFLAWLTYRITTTLDYTWKWHLIPRYLFRYDQGQGRWVANYLVQGLLTTLRLSLWAGLLALILGMLLALCRCFGRLYLRLLAISWIELLRNLPPLVIIFLFYFFLADQLIPVLDLDARADRLSGWPARLVAWCFGDTRSLSTFLSALVTLAVFESSYFAEIYRAGIESVERGQWEAAHALGLSRAQGLRRVILPQGLRRILPALAGQSISLIKDSAIVSVISIQELTYQGTQLMGSTYQTIEVWITIAAMYLVLTLSCSLVVRVLERRLARGAGQGMA
jgi:polar amino acid transport system permease protein